MGAIDRRVFIHRSVLLAGAGFLNGKLHKGNASSKLSFSTLGCPDWSFDTILSFAKEHGYSGIEWRGIQRQMDLTTCKEFKDAQARDLSKKKMMDHGLQFVNLGSSSTLHFLPGKERDKQLDEGKRYIELAHQLGCPYIRVFPNNFPKEQEKQQTLDLIITGLNELSLFAKGSDVKVLMETHGDLVHSGGLSTIMRSVSDASTGLIWDPCNMWTITREAPALVFSKLQTFIRHVHVKDAKWQGDKLSYCFLGKGQVPLTEVMEALNKGAYKGFYSFEWEKLWHPELEEPEAALADFPVAIKKYANL